MNSAGWPAYVELTDGSENAGGSVSTMGAVISRYGPVATIVWEQIREAKQTADLVLTAGITGQVFLLAQGVPLGEASERFIRDRNLHGFVDEARAHLAAHPGVIHLPTDCAVEAGGKRVEVTVRDLPTEHLILDIGARTIADYSAMIHHAATVFVNGPPGAYEHPNAPARTPCSSGQ